jgi:hypothetical protein
VGLKWSMLATTSWESMYETLFEYVDAKVRRSVGASRHGSIFSFISLTLLLPSLRQNKDSAEWDGKYFGKMELLGENTRKKTDFLLVVLTRTNTGNVPANYRRNDNPPRALGRWINCQHSAYGKDKLKTEYIEKLNKIGLKWSVHERRPVAASPDAAPSSTNANSNNNSVGDSTAEQGKF